MNKRHLSLKRETLTELSAADLNAVAGGAPPTADMQACLSKVPSYAQHTCFDCLTRQGCE